MNVEIVDKIENKLLERTELRVIVNHEGEAVPKREDVLAKVAAQLNKERNQVVLIHLTPKYGRGISEARIHVYEDPERALLIEKEYLLKRSNVLTEKEES